jgi:Nucleotidyl transferase AbiEii toxin, Type IV TA system
MLPEETSSDYQQDFLVNGKVKLSFFTADASLTQLLKPEDSNTIRIASLEELFASKALVCAIRSTTRDWFDMRTLIQDHSFTVADIHSVFESVGNPMGFSIAMQRLCSGRPQAGDPGLAPLVEMPPSADELAVFFQTKRNEFETQRASDVGLGRIRNAITKRTLPQP